MTPEWLAAITGMIVVLGSLIGVLWRVARSMDKQTLIADQIQKTLEGQWKRIDEHADDLASHGKRITDLEAWKKYHEKES